MMNSSAFPWCPPHIYEAVEGAVFPGVDLDRCSDLGNRTVIPTRLFHADFALGAAGGAVGFEISWHWQLTENSGGPSLPVRTRLAAPGIMIVS